MIKIKYVAIFTCVAILISGTLATAAPLDLLHSSDSSNNYKFTDFLKSRSSFNYVVSNMEKYVIESPNGGFYKAKEVNDAIEAGASDFTDAIKNLNPIEKPQVESKEFEVIEIE